VEIGLSVHLGNIHVEIIEWRLGNSGLSLWIVNWNFTQNSENSMSPSRNNGLIIVFGNVISLEEGLDIPQHVIATVPQVAFVLTCTSLQKI
jgi:hypothetical protein